MIMKFSLDEKKPDEINHDILFPDKVLGIFRNDIPLTDLILLHIKDISIKIPKYCHSLNGVSSPIYYQSALRRT